MVFYERLLPDSDPFTDLDQVTIPDIEQVSNTSIKVTISMLGVIGVPTSYIVKYQRMQDEFITIGSEQTQTALSNEITITGLTENAYYKVTTQLSNATGYGKKIYTFFRLNSNIQTPSKTGNFKDVGDKVTAKSFLSLTAPDSTSSKNKYAFAYSDFDSIQPGTYTVDTIGEGAFGRSARSYSEGYYSFGTSIIFDPLLKYKPQGAGLGFFVNSSRDSGYFVTIETSPTAAAYSTSPVKIFKLQGKQIKRLADSQKGNRATLDQIFAGTTYNIDIKVKILGLSVIITAYVNGFKIEATDTTGGVSGNSVNRALYPTTKVALLATKGTSRFDYVYADTIQRELYESDYLNLNLYRGQLANDFLNASYGELLYNSNNEDFDTTKKPKTYEEFGTVVREIRKRSVRFGGGPAIPIKWTTGANNLATVLAETKDNFKSEVLVLNNSSIVIPLSDNRSNQLAIYGTDIGFSGEIEYSTSPASEYSTTEPVIFESNWLQNQKDVESLANWIKGKIVNKSKIVTMKVFGNALISVGDIITIDYPYQGFTTSQKVIIVKVSQSYEGGLNTEIVGRTL